MTYEQWLQSTAYESVETLPDGDVRMTFTTNQQVLDYPIKPDNWINPWILTEQEIDTIRKCFRGGARKWRVEVESKYPNLCPQKEYRLKLAMNKERDISLCGKPKYAFNALGQWMPTGEYYKCNRPNQCPRCAERMKKAAYHRLTGLDGCRYLEVDKVERGNLIAEYGKDKVYCQPLPSGKILVVIDTDKPIGEEMNWRLAEQYAQVMPEGTKSSGNLGKQDDKEEENTDLVPIMHNEYTVDATKEQIEEVAAKVMEATAELSPTNPEELQSAINKCEYWLQRYAKELNINIYFHRRVSFLVNKKEINWTNRKEVRIAQLKQESPG